MQKGLVIGFALILISCTVFAAGIFTVLEDNVDDVIAYLTNGDGVVEKETANPARGAEALAVNVTGGDGQKFNPNVPDWALNIVENPSADDEFRYITFSWKKDGGEGIQLQLHGNPDTWGHRYHGGQNVRDWNPSIQVSTEIPATWESHTRDLFEDWGAFTLTGIAFTAWDGNAGLWDDVFLHQTDVSPVTSVEPEQKLATAWAKMKNAR